MIKGILFYKTEDYERNKWFANEIVSKGKEYGLDIEIGIFNPYDINEAVEMAKKTKASFALVRSIGFINVKNLNQALEEAGLRVFNNSMISRIANNKMETFLWAKKSGLFEKGLVINSEQISLKPTHMPKLLLNNQSGGIKPGDVLNFEASEYIYLGEDAFLKYLSYEDFCSELERETGFIMKSCDGHGGSEVFYINDEKSCKEAISVIAQSYIKDKQIYLNNNEFLPKLCVVQDICDEIGIDMRVYVLGGKVLAAVRRDSKVSFKSNFSLGGSATYIPKENLSCEQKFVIDLIVDNLKPDFVGIDFIRNKGKWVLNEIEDAVGCRMLYQVTEIDPVKLYVEYLATELNNGDL
ncbi:MAG: hypothetical protein MJ113_02575 [Lachnospiraceae bacterium]|nr:hypothetical protein [Lachnospiraceae bacterium]